MTTMNTYSEYFDIDEGYWPEINPSSIKDPTIKWEKTYPHKTFVDLLKATEMMLARGNNSTKKGIWIEGAYGTGKSRVAWTLKNVLDCTEDSLKGYFAEYAALQAEPDLLSKLIEHKKSKIVTAYRYASGSIDNDRALIMAVFESVTKALKESGVSYKGENTLRGGMALWLSDEANKLYFNSLIALPEYRGMGSFAGKDLDDIIRLLRNPNADVDALMRDVFTIAESRGITALTTSMDDLISWLTDVIAQNDLKAIILVWDEFSAYFRKNRSSLDEFQKLSELSNIAPFYLMIVTHMSGSIFSESDQTGKIVRDRFVRKEIELPNSIAFELIKFALKIKDSQADIWEPLANDLNSRMNVSREAVRSLVWKGTSDGDDVLRKMIPIHPLAALLLKNISSAFASNQRSMFNFIKNAETEDLQAFQWFINTHSPNNGDILTIDYLWNFFYEKGTDDYGNGAGRSNLDSIIRSTLDTYSNNESDLNDEEKKILKTVLMMQAMSQKLGDSIELLLPTEQNINNAFEGTDLEEHRATNIVKHCLVKKGILYAKPMGNNKIQYAAAAVSGDQAQVDEIKRRIVKETKTSSLVFSSDLSTALNMNEGLRFRYDVSKATIDNFTSIISKIINEKPSFKIHAVITFARNDEEQGKVRMLIKNAMQEEKYKDIVFIEASTVLGGERFDQWVALSSNEEYWRDKDAKLAADMLQKSKGIIDDWRTRISNGSFTLYTAYQKYGEVYSNASSLITALVSMVLRIYPLSFDNARVSDNFFVASKLPSGAVNGINQTYGGPFLKDSVMNLMNGAWEVPNYWEINKSLPISKLKIKVDELIQKAFESEGRRIAISDIFDFLMSLGFMPCNLYAYLTGFLLKEYANESYRYTDGETGEKMSADKLGEIIGECIKHKNTPINRYKDKYIAIMSNEQIAFAKFTNEVFKIDDSISIEQAAIRIRTKLSDLVYPIWCFKEIDENGLEDFLDKLAAIANSDNSNESVSKIASNIGSLSIAMPTAAKNLAALLTKENATRAIKEFLKVFENGDILKLANEIDNEDPLSDVRKQAGSSNALWLWDQGTWEEELRKLITDYKIVAESNRINIKTSSLADCLSKWREMSKSIRMPCSALISEFPSLKAMLGMIKDLASSSDLNYEKRSAFLKELEINGKEFSGFILSKMSAFRDIYSVYLTGFSDSEVDIIYSKLPVNSFVLDKPDYAKHIEEEAVKIRIAQDKFKLHKLWEEKTNSKSPKDWSEKHRTPILVLVPTALQAKARAAFGAIDRNDPGESDVKLALEFLEANETLLSSFNDTSIVNSAFTKDILGRFSVVLNDLDEVRSHLEEAVHTTPHEWYGNKAVNQELEKFAKAKYDQWGCEKALGLIESMDATIAKDYLKKLIKDNMNVGIEIIFER